jgi:hypothetical protein
MRSPSLSCAFVTTAILVLGAAPATAARNTCSGVTTARGDTQLRAALARSSMDVDGTGVKVGVISDSLGDTTSAVAAGDLPGSGNPCGRTRPVQVVDDAGSTSSGRGRSLLEVVHDIAPGADLAFSAAGSTQEAMATRIRKLRDAGAKVIVDDFSFGTEPSFQEGPVAVAIDDVTATGVVYVTSAGDQNVVDNSNRNTSTWETPAFRSMACPAPVGGPACEDFDPSAATTDSALGISDVGSKAFSVTLSWDEPYGHASTDFDVYALDGNGTIIGSGADTQNGDDKPTETANVASGASIVFIVIKRFSGTANRRLKLTIGGLSGAQDVYFGEHVADSNGDIFGPSITGHRGAANAITVGAVDDAATAVAPYSARGPMTLYIDRADLANPGRFNTPQVVAKPDVVASDCARTTSVITSLCGASASAAYDAGIAALQLEANPNISPAQVASAQRSTARAVGAFPIEARGGGLVDALGAVGVNAPAPVVTITTPPAESSTETTPAIFFGSNRPVTATCALDGADATACTSPYIPGPLGPGRHSVSVTGVDAAGHSGTAGPVSFTVQAPAASGGGGTGGTTPPADKTAPSTTVTGLSKKPKIADLLKGITLKLAPNEAASFEVAELASASSVRLSRTGDITLAEGKLKLGTGTRSLKLKASKKLVGKAKKITVRFVIVATDAAGNRRTTVKTLKAQR